MAEREVDDDVPVMLVEYPTPTLCELAAARLRGEGIDASVSLSMSRGMPLPSGHCVYVHRRDAERAATIVDWTEAVPHGVAEPRSRLGRWFWRHLGGRAEG